MVNVSIRNYGREIEGHCVKVGNLTLYFSYNTVIAFACGDGIVISENCWGYTTGGHLNSIREDKSIRISSAQFITELNKVLKHHKLI